MFEKLALMLIKFAFVVNDFEGRNGELNTPQ